MIRLGIVIALLVPALGALAEPIPPAPREGDTALQEKWMKLHEEFVSQARQGQIDFLLLGDSITNRWPVDLWDQAFGPWKAARFGIEGEQVQNLHWRLLNGEFETLQPKVVVLLIGTNNVPREYTARQIADSIGAISQLVLSKSPRTKVLILGMLPRNEKPTNIFRDRIAFANLLVSQLDNRRSVRFLDFSAKVTTSEGMITREIMPDFLHPSRLTYENFMKDLRPLILEMAEDTGVR